MNTVKTENRTKTKQNQDLDNMLTDMAFCHLQENLVIKRNRCCKKKKGIDATKTVSKRVVQKNAETTADLIGNKINDLNYFNLQRAPFQNILV